MACAEHLVTWTWPGLGWKDGPVGVSVLPQGEVHTAGLGGNHTQRLGLEGGACGADSITRDVVCRIALLPWPCELLLAPGG